MWQTVVGNVEVHFPGGPEVSHTERELVEWTVLAVDKTFRSDVQHLYRP